MASSSDHIPIPPTTKSRLSPLDFRNTELVSRLLAATPPYLYNMSLLPNSYFFSEMLRSLVQAKQESAANAEALMSTSIHSRRSRKRPWLVSRQEEYSKLIPKIEKSENTNWSKMQAEKLHPTEPSRRSPASRSMEDMKLGNEKHVSYQNMPSDTSNPGLVLPPAPPIWFPPIYPSPYVDPLHFFIDLRVSGHIYDKSQKENSGMDRQPNKDYPSTVISTSESEQPTPTGNALPNLVPSKYGSHNSAFSVPSQKTNKNSPMNLSQMDKDIKCTKFDVKSMGFEKNSNRTGTNYILPNIETIYKNVNNTNCNMSDTKDCSVQKRLKNEDDKSINYFFDNNQMDMNSSRSMSPVDVVDSDEQGYKIDIQS